MFEQEKIYMPVPQKMGRGVTMGRGPYEKSGLVEDTSLPPGREVKERFEIPYPAQLVKKGGKKVTEVTDRELDVTIELWYLPFGNRRTSAQQWRHVQRKVTLPALE